MWMWMSAIGFPCRESRCDRTYHLLSSGIAHIEYSTSTARRRSTHDSRTNTQRAPLGSPLNAVLLSPSLSTPQVGGPKRIRSEFPVDGEVRTLRPAERREEVIDEGLPGLDEPWPRKESRQVDLGLGRPGVQELLPVRLSIGVGCQGNHLALLWRSNPGAGARYHRPNRNGRQESRRPLPAPGARQSIGSLRMQGQAPTVSPPRARRSHRRRGTLP